MKLLIDAGILSLKKEPLKGLFSGIVLLHRNNVTIQTKRKITDKTILRLLNSEGIQLSVGNTADYSLEISNSGVKLTPPGIQVSDFKEVTEFLLIKKRTAAKERTTAETSVQVSLNLDGTGKAEIDTGIGFFDHMLSQIARHGNIDLEIRCKGDLHIDDHHTVEDTGIVLGEALHEALGDKKGIKRYGYIVPMDDCVAACAIDLGGRISLIYKANFRREKIGDYATELTEEFFRGLASGLKANVYIKAKGKNEHHKAESIFKAFAKALNEACRMDERSGNTLPSTKGVL
ncbi:MAG: imidazoleglycerol-phosphate dehydratase HisB [Ignavibacteriaceae bacterium]|nr:imidazoleglycerol-phosphate dehydratase HisB [Ignavibacteriaceae bacterium]